MQLFLENSLKFYSLVPPTLSNLNTPINTVFFNNIIMTIMNISKVFKENLHKIEDKLKFSNNNQIGFQIVIILFFLKKIQFL